MALFAALLGLFGASAAAAYFMDIAFAASPPPAPSITSSPSNPTTSTSATFVFKDSQSGVTFKCALDTSTFTTCSSPVSYSSFAQGSHTFKVEAVSHLPRALRLLTRGRSCPPPRRSPRNRATPRRARRPRFKYSDTLSGVSFKCSLDSARPTPRARLPGSPTRCRQAAPTPSLSKRRSVQTRHLPRRASPSRSRLRRRSSPRSQPIRSLRPLQPSSTPTLSRERRSSARLIRRATPRAPLPASRTPDSPTGHTPSRSRHSSDLAR